MKKLTLILILITSFNLFAEKQIELTPIVLPYDSLNIDEVYGYGATIIARSGNTIYHSTDDGARWDIALESETKLNQLYSKDPHTVFAIGDSGLVYRTMDYGATWIDESVDTELDLVTMAAKDAVDYLTLTSYNIGFHRELIESKYERISNGINTRISSVVYQDSIYIFGGGYSYRQVDYYIGTSYYEYILPEFTYNGDYVEKHDSYIFSSTTSDYINRYLVDSLKLFSSSHGLIKTGKLVNKGHSGLALSNELGKTLYLNDEGFYIYDKNIIHANIQSDILNVFTKEEDLYQIRPNSLEALVSNRDMESIKIDISTINFVSDYSENNYYIASNKSTIYKASIYELIPFENPKYDEIISLNGRYIQFDENVELISISNYLGQNLSYTNIRNNGYKLEEGVSIVTFINSSNEIKTIKLLVLE